MGRKAKTAPAAELDSSNPFFVSTRVSRVSEEAPETAMTEDRWGDESDVETDLTLADAAAAAAAPAGAAAPAAEKAAWPTINKRRAPSVDAGVAAERRSAGSEAEAPAEAPRSPWFRRRSTGTSVKPEHPHSFSHAPRRASTSAAPLQSHSFSKAKSTCLPSKAAERRMSYERRNSNPNIAQDMVVAGAMPSSTPGSRRGSGNLGLGLGLRRELTRRGSSGNLGSQLGSLAFDANTRNSISDELIEEEGGDDADARPRYLVLHPQSALRRAWDFGMLLVMIYIAVGEPVRLGLGLTTTCSFAAVQRGGASLSDENCAAPYGPFDIVLTAWLTIDILVNFRTGIVIERTLVMSPLRVAMWYLSPFHGWCVEAAITHATIPSPPPPLRFGRRRFRPSSPVASPRASS